MKQRYARYTAAGHGPTPPVTDSITVVGSGALGTHILEILARQGFTDLTVVDRDIVRTENLSTSTLYTTEHIGTPKPVAAAKEINRINPAVDVTVRAVDVHGRHLDPVEDAEIILDATDNMETRHLLNEHGHKEDVPVFFTGCTGTSFFSFPVTYNGKGTCFNCVYPEPETGVLPTCTTHGLLKETVVTAASTVTTQLLSYLADPASFEQRLYTGTVTPLTAEALSVEPDATCRVCHDATYTYTGTAPDAEQLCGSNTVQIRDTDIAFATLKERLQDRETVTVSPQAIIIQHGEKHLAVFPDGRILVTGVDTVEAARQLTAQYLSH